MEELNTSAATLIENHSSIHKTDLGSTAMVSSTINSDSPSHDLLIPVNGDGQHTEPLCRKSLENDQHVITVNGKNSDVHKSKDSEMELDDSSKDSKMDVESVNKDDVMDVDLEDHMDVDNHEDKVVKEGEKLDAKNERDANDTLDREKPEEKSESEKTEKNEVALNPSGPDVSAIQNVEELISEAKGFLEKSLEDPLHISQNDSGAIVSTKDATDSEVTAAEFDSLFSDLEKNMSSQNVTESLLNLSQNLIDENLNSEGINLGCSEKTDLLTSSSLPDEKDPGDLTNFDGSSVQEKDSIKSADLVNEVGPKEKENVVIADKEVNENQSLGTQEKDEDVLTQDIDKDAILNDVTSKEAMDVDEGKAAEPMDLDLEEHNDVEMHGLPEVKESSEQNENVIETDANVVETNDVNANAVAEETNSANEQNVTGEVVDVNKTVSASAVTTEDGKDAGNTDISDLVSELDDLLNSPKETAPTQEHDSSADTIIDEEKSPETDEVPFGILEATSIPPTEFENMESTTAEDPGKNQSTVLNLSELAQNVLNESKPPKRPIRVKTIKQEKLDFNIKEEMIEESYDQITIDNVDIKPNVSGLNSGNKKKKRKKGPYLTQFSYKKKKKATHDSGNKKPKNNSKKVTPAKQPKSAFTVINLMDKSSKNPAVKRNRSSLNTVPVSVNNSTPSAKKPRISLPKFRSSVTRTAGKRLLRSAGEIAEKIQDLVKESPTKVNKPVKSKVQVARKSTTQVQTRTVARKRGKPFFRAEPEPIFVDTNFGGQDMDMFINENDDEDSVAYYDRKGRCDYSRTSPVRKKLRPCEVVIQRMPVIDRLLPAKKEPEKLEPNVCELCDPKRIFLSKSSLADHIKQEHLRNSADTTVIPPVEPSPKKQVDEVKSCSFCKKPFHSKNRLLQHMKTCKNEIVPKVINNIPGIDLSNLNKSVTISYAKKNESPTTNHICKVCNRKFLMATGLKSHMKTHKTATPPKSNSQKPELDPLQIDITDSPGPGDAAFSVITKPKRMSKNLVMKFRREKALEETPGGSKKTPLKKVESAKIPPTPPPAKNPRDKSTRSGRKTALKARPESPEIEILEEKISICSFTGPTGTVVLSGTSGPSVRKSSPKKNQKNGKSSNAAQTKTPKTPRAPVASKTRSSSRKK